MGDGPGCANSRIDIQGTHQLPSFLPPQHGCNRSSRLGCLWTIIDNPDHYRLLIGQDGGWQECETHPEDAACRRQRCGQELSLAKVLRWNLHPQLHAHHWIDFKVRTVPIEGKEIKLQLWDTAGQERFRTITAAYYRGGHGVVLVYDVTDQNSFSHIKIWMKGIEQHASQGVNKILVGNKADMDDKRVVSTEQGQELAEKYGIRFYETSAKTGQNVDDMFLLLAKEIKHRVIDPMGDEPEEPQATSSSPKVDLTSSKDSQPQASGGCCGK